MTARACVRCLSAWRDAAGTGHRSGRFGWTFGDGLCADCRRATLAPDFSPSCPATGAPGSSCGCIACRSLAVAASQRAACDLFTGPEAPPPSAPNLDLFRGTQEDLFNGGAK